MAFWKQVSRALRQTMFYLGVGIRKNNWNVGVCRKHTWERGRKNIVNSRCMGFLPPPLGLFERPRGPFRWPLFLPCSKDIASLKNVGCCTNSVCFEFLEVPDSPRKRQEQGVVFVPCVCVLPVQLWYCLCLFGVVSLWIKPSCSVHSAHSILVFATVTKSSLTSNSLKSRKLPSKKIQHQNKGCLFCTERTSCKRPI